MMKIDVLTLFPEMFNGFKTESIIKRAISNDNVEINIVNIRDYSLDKHRRVDDYQYGGGAGMVLMCDPIFRAIEDISSENSKVIMMTPQGKTFNQTLAVDFSKLEHIILLCGHYEGFDERILSIVDMEVSIGDYVLTGGEIPSMVIMDSTIRLLDGVINEESHVNDSFTNDIFDYPVYTKPRIYKGLSVPEVLLNGNHAEINKYRESQAIKKTKEIRADLLKGE